MKKTTLIAVLISIIVLLVSCKELKKNNPYDPDSSSYAGITYKGQIWYPDSADIKAMIVQNSKLVFAGFNNIDGYCVMKITSDSTYIPVGTTGDTLGTFRFIKDICADNSGNIYAVDNKAFVQVISPSNTMSAWPITYTVGIDNLSIECLNNFIFISNNMDKTINKYTLTGIAVDSITLSSTAYGNFIPGKIVKGVNNIYVINSVDQTVIIKLTDMLYKVGEIKFEDNIIDGCLAGQQMQLIASQAAYKVDSDLNISLKWCNFGVGPGKTLNGKLAAYDDISGEIYILDGITIKKFGE